MTFKFEGRGLTVEQPTRIAIIDERTLAPFKSVIEEKEFTAYIEGYSTDSRRMTAFSKAWHDKRNAASPRPSPLTADERERFKVELYAALTVGWCIVTPDGDVIDEPYSEAAGIAFFAAPEWAMYRDQYEVGLSARANFMKKASKVS